MNKKTHYAHVIDAIFPVAVFFVFAASALIVLLLAADIYANISNAADSHFSSRTAFAYVMEKLRQNDVEGGLTTEQIQGKECLALYRTDNNAAITTYIYEYNGKLMELRVRDGVDFSLSDGSEITTVQSFDITRVSDQLFVFTIVDTDAKTFSLTFSERSCTP